MRALLTSSYHAPSTQSRPSSESEGSAKTPKAPAPKGSEAFDKQMETYKQPWLDALKTLATCDIPMKEVFRVAMNWGYSAMHDSSAFSRNLQAGMAVDKVSSEASQKLTRLLRGYHQGSALVTLDMRQGLSIFNTFFNSKEANRKIASIRVEKKRNALQRYKTAIHTFLTGGKQDMVHIIEALSMPMLLGLFGRLAEYIDSPETIGQIDWDEEIPGLNRTREQERLAILDDHPEIKKPLEKYFNEIKLFLCGELNRAPKLLLIGGPGTGKTELLQRIAIMLGSKRVAMNQKELADEGNVRGKNSIFNALTREGGILGMLPWAWITASHTNISVRLDDLKWNDFIPAPGMPLMKGIKNLPWAMELLDPKTDSIPLLCMGLPKEEAPEMPTKEMFFLMSSNDPIPSDVRLRDTVFSINMPPTSADKKIKWTQTAAEKSDILPPHLWEAAQYYLPFIAEADNYYIHPARPGVREVQIAYRTVISTLQLKPTTSEQEMKRTILRILLRTENVTFAQVKEAEGKIDEKRKDLIEKKIEWAHAELDGTKKLPIPVRDVAKSFLPYLAELDTNQFHRSNVEMKKALDHLLAILKEKPQELRTKVKENVKEKMGEGYPLFPYAPLPNMALNQASQEVAEQSILDFPSQLVALHKILDENYDQKTSGRWNTIVDIVLGTLGGHGMICVGVWMALVDLFPKLAAHSAAGLALGPLVDKLAEIALNKVEGTNIDYTNPDREEELEKSRVAQKLKFMYERLLNNDLSNQYIENLPDERLKNSLLGLKKMARDSINGPIFGTRIDINNFPRYLELVKIPAYIQPIDWQSHIPGSNKTRQQGKEELLNRYPELRANLDIFFHDLDLLVQGKLKSQIRLVFVGGSQGKIESIFDEIEKIAGLGSIALNPHDLVNPIALFGQPFSSMLLEKDRWEAQKLPVQMLEQKGKNFFLRITGINWHAIGNNDTTLKFLDPDPMRMIEPLPCFKPANVSLDNGPAMDRSKMILLMAAPEDIPEKYHALRSRVLTISNPPTETESSIQHAEMEAAGKAAGNQEMNQAWENARKFLPFLVWGDIHGVGKGGGDSIVRIYKDLIGAMYVQEQREKDVLKEIVRDLYANVRAEEAPPVEEVQTAIREKQQDMAKRKKEIAEDELEADTDLAGEIRERIQEQLDFMIGLDTYVMHRTGMEAMRAALQEVAASLKQNPEMDQEEIKENILVSIVTKNPPMDLRVLLDEKLILPIPDDEFGYAVSGVREQRDRLIRMHVSATKNG